MISVDPIYDQPAEDIVGRVTANLAHAPDWLTAHRDTIDWGYLGSPDAHIRASEVAADLFAVDYTAHPEHYVAAALPALPFPDRHFRLALSANLLFVYTQDLSFDDHLAALLELTRVTHEEVRVHPLLDLTGTVYSHLDQLRAALTHHDVVTELRSVSKTWLLGGEHMLVCRRGTAAQGSRPRRSAAR